MRRGLVSLFALAAAVGCSGSVSSRQLGALEDRPPRVAVVAPSSAENDDREPPAALARTASHRTVPSELRLSNGVRILMVERHDLPLVAASFVLSHDFTEARTVVPHLYAHAMKGGSEEYSGRSMWRFLGVTGASIHASCEGDAVVLGATMLAPHATELISRLSTVVASPAFESVELVRGQRSLLANASWLKQYPNAQAAAERLLLGDAHPSRLRAFPPDPIRKASRADLVRFEDAYLSADNLTVAVVGDIRRDAVERVLEARLGKLPRRAPSRGKTELWREPPSPTTARIAIVPWRGATQSKIALGFAGPPARSEDRAALLLLRELLTSMSGRLNERIRAEFGATYGVHADIDAWRTGGMVEFTTAVETDRTVPVIGALVREIARVSIEAVPDEELARAKGRASSRAHSDGHSPYENELHRLKAIAVRDLPLDHFTQLASRIDALTAEDVRVAAAKYLRVDRVQIAVAGDPAALEVPLRELAIGDVSTALPP